MKTTRIGSPRQTETSLWPTARRVGSVIAYAGVPLSTLSPAAGILTSLNVLTSYYLVGIFGVIGVLRGARVESSLVRLSYFLLGWYCILLAIELIHGGPFHYFPPRGPNYLADYFPLLVLPFFAIGRAALARVSFSLSVCSATTRACLSCSTLQRSPGFRS